MSDPDIRIATTDEDRRACFDLRRAVFVVEQHVPLIEEFDAFDTAGADCTHWIARLGGRCVGTARVVDADGARKIQRVAVARSVRGTGLGAALMGAVMDAEAGRTLLLDAQVQALGFYERLGFVAEGPEFDDAGIAHRRMRRMQG